MQPNLRHLFGLSIALEDARLHGGWLEAWGEPGQGAVFRLTLPLDRAVGTSLPSLVASLRAWGVTDAHWLPGPAGLPVVWLATSRSTLVARPIVLPAPMIERPRRLVPGRMAASAAISTSASIQVVAGSSTITHCQPWLFEPVGACSAIFRHSSISSRGTGRSRSSRSRSPSRRVLR